MASTANEHILLRENKKLWEVARPFIANRFSTFGIGLISLIFVARSSSPTDLAAYALVSTVLVGLAHGLLLGMASPLEALCRQSYCAKQYHMLGIHLQRSWIVLFMTTLIILPIFIFSTPLLILLGQDEDVANKAGMISKWFIPPLFSYMWSQSLQIYLQAQSNNVIIVSYTAILAPIIHVCLCWMLNVKLGFGVDGVMISMTATMWIPVLSQIRFVLYGGCPKAWQGFSHEAFEDLGTTIKLSISSAIMVCLELWYIPILVLLTGHDKNNADAALCALSIWLNVNGWDMMIFTGLMEAARVRTRVERDVGSTTGAIIAEFNALLVSWVFGMVPVAVIVVFRIRVVNVFTNDVGVVSDVADLSGLLFASLMVNHLLPVLSGILIGRGWQREVAYINLTCCYILSIPVGVSLAYKAGIPFKGIWIGMVTGKVVQFIIIYLIGISPNCCKMVAVRQEKADGSCSA